MTVLCWDFSGVEGSENSPVEEGWFPSAGLEPGRDYGVRPIFEVERG